MKNNFAIAAAVFVTSVLIWAFVRNPPVTSADWASWVQAVGSIFAIAASVGIVRWELKNQREVTFEDARQERIRNIETARELVGGAVQVVKKIAEQQAPSHRDASKMRHEIGSMIDAISSLDHVKFSSYKATEAILVSLSTMRQMLTDIDGKLKDQFNNQLTTAYLKNCAAESLEDLEKRLVTLSEEIRIAREKT
jgi:hypothetical protein